MDAAVVDLKDFAVRTPEQVFRVFFKLYGAVRVKTELWQHFGDWASVRGMVPDVDGQEAKVALLFDQLIALVEALEMLRCGETSAGCCVVCGGGLRNRNGDDPAGRA